MAAEPVPDTQPTEEERRGLALYEIVLRSRPPTPFTFADLDLLPEMDGYRYELLDGMLLVSPAPTVRHQHVSRELFRQLDGACPEGLEVFYSPLDYKPTAERAFQPDLVVARRVDFDRDALRRTPLLLVEVQSPSNRVLDRTAKLTAYAEAGVPSYWLVDPDEPSLVAYTLTGEGYVETGRIAGSEVLHVDVPFALDVRLPASL